MKSEYFLEKTQNLPPLYYRFDLEKCMIPEDRDFIILGGGMLYPLKGTSPLFSISLLDHHNRLCVLYSKPDQTPADRKEMVTLFTRILNECDEYKKEPTAASVDHPNILDSLFEKFDTFQKDLNYQIDMYLHCIELKGSYESGDDL